MNGFDLSALDYVLPDRLIAQDPPAERDGARLLVVRRATAELIHARIADLPSHLPPSLVVLNDTRVMAARLRATKPSGGRAELLLFERIGARGLDERWRCYGRASKGLPAGTVLHVDERIALTVEDHEPVAEGALVLRVHIESRCGVPVGELIDQIGEVPLPPYIRRAPVHADRERYQTVYARELGSVAAPTAGLHFSERLIDRLRAAGSDFAHVTLHVGPGTFAPIRATRLEEHPMHEEFYSVSEDARVAIERARQSARPVLAVGTTVVRTLESAGARSGQVESGEGATRLFIRPPYGFLAVDALLTNFHLPRSTLLALVFAFGGVELVQRAYREAIDREYRFFSYGDAMLLL